MLALGHTLLFLLKGRLPWQGIYAPSIDWKLVRMGEMKSGRALRDLLSTTPPEFTAYFDHCLALAFEAKPDYSFLKKIFRERMEREGWDYDWKFDWIDGRLLEKGTLIHEEYALTLESNRPEPVV